MQPSTVWKQSHLICLYWISVPSHSNWTNWRDANWLNLWSGILVRVLCLAAMPIEGDTGICIHDRNTWIWAIYELSTSGVPSFGIPLSATLNLLHVPVSSIQSFNGGTFKSHSRSHILGTVTWQDIRVPWSNSGGVRSRIKHLWKGILTPEEALP